MRREKRVEEEREDEREEGAGAIARSGVGSVSRRPQNSCYFFMPTTQLGRQEATKHLVVVVLQRDDDQKEESQPSWSPVPTHSLDKAASQNGVRAPRDIFFHFLRARQRHQENEKYIYIYK